MNYPFEPLAEYARVRYRAPNQNVLACATSVSYVEQALGYRWHRHTIHRWSKDGIPPRSADAVACELGLHIDILWPERRAA